MILYGRKPIGSYTITSTTVDEFADNAAGTTNNSILYAKEGQLAYRLTMKLKHSPPYIPRPRRKQQSCIYRFRNHKELEKAIEDVSAL